MVGARVSVHVEIQLGDILTLVLQLPLLLALALLSSFPNGAPIQLYYVQRFKTGNVIVASKEEDFTVLNRIHLANVALRNEENPASRQNHLVNLQILSIRGPAIIYSCSVKLFISHGISFARLSTNVYGNGAPTRHLDYFIERFLESCHLSMFIQIE